MKISQVIKRKYHQLFWTQRIFTNRINLRREIKKAIRKNKILKNREKDKTYLKESKEFLQKHFKGYTNTNWHLYYSAFNGIKKVNYIPDELYYPLIEPTLNKNKLESAYCDKNAYNFFFTENELPKTIYKIINDRFYDNENNVISKTDALSSLQKIKTELVLKPAIFSGAGKNIHIEPSETIVKELSKEKYKKASYIIQHKIEQHPEMAKFHPESVNTCRVLTARVENKIVLLSAYLRIGRNRTRIDNGMAGGIMCGIDKTGKIKDYAIGFEAVKLWEHPNSKIPFKGYSIPNYSLVREFCTHSHKQFLHFTLISWDIAIDKNAKPVCIEYNLRKQAIAGHQLINGPLFGDFTEELLEQYKKDYKKNYTYL